MQADSILIASEPPSSRSSVAASAFRAASVTARPETVGGRWSTNHVGGRTCDVGASGAWCLRARFSTVEAFGGVDSRASARLVARERRCRFIRRKLIGRGRSALALDVFVDARWMRSEEQTDFPSAPSDGDAPRTHEGVTFRRRGAPSEPTRLIGRGPAETAGAEYAARSRSASCAVPLGGVDSAGRAATTAFASRARRRPACAARRESEDRDRAASALRRPARWNAAARARGRTRALRAPECRHRAAAHAAETRCDVHQHMLAGEKMVGDLAHEIVRLDVDERARAEVGSTTVRPMALRRVARNSDAGQAE